MHIILILIALFAMGIALNMVKQLFEKNVSLSSMDFFSTALVLGLICILVWCGFPSLIGWLPPLHIIFILIFGMTVILFTSHVTIFGNILLDNIILALVFVMITITVSRGFLNIFPFGITWNLIVSWFVISSLLAVVLRTLCWLLRE